MATINFQTTSQYSNTGSYYNGVSTYQSVQIGTQTLSCQDIQNSVTDWATMNSIGYYPVDCDFSTLSGSGMIFMQDPNTFQTYGSEVSVQTQGVEPIPYDSFMEVQTIEMIIAFVVLGIINFKSILWG